MATAKTSTTSTVNTDAAKTDADAQAPTPPPAPDTDAQAQADLAARVAELEARNALLEERAASAAAGVPQAPDGHVWVVAASGAPIPSIPTAPRAWLDSAKHLLPEGARKATPDEQKRLEAMVAAEQRPRL
ncbi:hypothetical protein [Arsenicicoccus dermatophilus]|uniref:hypothetical protein n=1 Tax=Arsenicicoccus dermatophilus TaxID=1076331 RepID=UPI001F4D0DF9|nr:hypothetical protein [Arsenicicoccus dermatophilus]MCH8613466.1 hypothetical protein [Arsenicicoccus dermatophilus]